ncbi:MAG: TetR/AcrR family transcriptional regulator [Moraxellaceae bacterium]|nr:TetR/AcrR family transcriptional regulator [Moraxellaceae bacterium]MDZ4387723.1 TetR/AcrR family transcriptional regulator [Moraxellaceae bacterium]
MSPSISKTNAIRPKVSKRKSRSDEVDHKARAPQQQRSQRRFDAILDATTELLKTSNVEDLSFNDIAEKADISPPSVHYMFPSMSALLDELLKRFNRRYTDIFFEIEHKLSVTKVTSWQSWIRSMAEANREHFNSNRAFAEIALGPIMNRASRHAIIAVNATLASSMIGSMSSIFMLPEVPDLHRKMTLSLDVFDALWGRAYMEHGTIDEATFEESIQVVIAYLRLILPETLAQRTGS